MDFAFSRRVALNKGAVDLDSLLATIGAAQAAGATARAQHRLAAQDKIEHDADPRLALFAGSEHGLSTECSLASFAPSFSVRQFK